MSLLAPATAAGQALPLDSLFQAHRQPLAWEADTPSGPGWNLILDEAARAQFVMVGESHGVKEIPPFTAALFGALHERAGYRYLALEDGPYAVEMLMAPGVRGDHEATTEMANRYPNALQFRNDQEVKLIADVGAVSSAQGAAVWGLDQTWGAHHLLDRLHGLAAGPSSRALIARMLDEVRELEALRPAEGRARYISDRLKAADLAALRRELGADPEAARLLEMLETSFEIYDSRRDRRSIYLSNDRRERYMRAQLMREYREARANGDSVPRAVLKFGQWHAMKGVLNWGQVVPLGTFVSELARSNGLESLHIWTGLVNEPGHYWTLSEYPDYAAIASAGSTDSWWVVDLRPLRPLVAAGEVADVNEEMKKVIFGFDLALLIGGGNPGSYERVREAR